MQQESPNEEVELSRIDLSANYGTLYGETGIISP